MKKIICIVCFTLCTIYLFAQPKVIAHRGYWKSSNSSENSIAALLEASKIGVYGSECDVWLTSDNKLIVNHDRTYGGLNMENSTLAQLIALKHPNGENLSSFEEYLIVAKECGILLIVDVKTQQNVKIIQEIDRIARKHNALHLIEILAWHDTTGREAIRIMGGIPVYFLTYRNPPTPAVLKEKGYTGLDYSMEVLKSNPEWVTQAHELGLKVNVWTVNPKEDMLYFIKANVDFITTDQPEELQELISKYPN